MDRRNKQGWATEPYVWLILLFPLLAVIGGIVTTWLAVSSDDGLVVDDYYKRGLEINRTLERDRAAQGYDLKSIIHTTEDDRKLRIILQGNRLFTPPEKITLQLLHPTRSGHDRKLLLEHSGSGAYHGGLPPLIKGNWHVLIEAQDWRLLDFLFIL
ncbi:MAG: FixH family protein [Gammaproteobacteria bacterium]|nr:FixH family protein [Gammaproteobacteria bacterium]